ncbi:MAG: hypothetical protein GC157_15160 [Frankiales bacterium]|nr:hypothetical protein [Frankiales bacterium]
MIIGAAFVPATPLLVPEVASGAAGELDDVRGAALTALREAASGAERVVVVGAGAAMREHRDGVGSLRGLGVAYDVPLDPGAPPAAVDGQGRLVLPLTLGAWLLARVGWPGDRVALEVDPAAADDVLDAAGAALAADPGPTALLVVADGSASRTEKAPASLHPDAAAFDAAVAAALREGDARALAAVDRARAAAVTSAGRPAWRVAAAALGGEAYDAALLCDTAPYGVGYLVARWRRTGS